MTTPVCFWRCLLAAPVAFPAHLPAAFEPGRPGGRLVVAQRAEPKTLNPVTALDSASREVIHRMMADLVHINRATQRTEPALASSWTVSGGGRRYLLHLRRGLRFSDGHPFDADDVVFTFQVYLDEKVGSPQRDLLIVGGKPIAVRKQDAWTVAFEFAEPYAPAERLFDSLAVLPRHLLEAAWREGRLARAWTLNTPPAQIAGLGPFRMKEYVPGQRLVLERNPYYWKRDSRETPLPYLDQLVFLFVAGEDGQAMRFQAGKPMSSAAWAPATSLCSKRTRRAATPCMSWGPGSNITFCTSTSITWLGSSPKWPRARHGSATSGSARRSRRR